MGEELKLKKRGASEGDQCVRVRVARGVRTARHKRTLELPCALGAPNISERKEKYKATMRSERAKHANARSALRPQGAEGCCLLSESCTHIHRVIHSHCVDYDDMVLTCCAVMVWYVCQWGFGLTYISASFRAFPIF